MTKYEAEISMAYFDALEIDETEYRLNGHVGPDIIAVENVDEGEVEELHIDEITRKIEQASEVTLIE